MITWGKGGNTRGSLEGERNRKREGGREGGRGWGGYCLEWIDIHRLDAHYCCLERFERRRTLLGEGQTVV